MVLPRIGRIVLRNLRRVRISNLLLTALVALNLTLVCQGHDIAHHHLGPHLTFLGGPSHIMPAGNHDTAAGAPISLVPTPDAFGPADTPSTAPTQTDLTSTDMPGMDQFDAGQLTALATASPNSVGANITSAVTAPPLETLSLDTLSFMLLPLLLRRGPNLRHLETAATIPVKAQTSTAPEPPPPRPGPT